MARSRFTSSIRGTLLVGWLLSCILLSCTADPPAAHQSAGLGGPTDVGRSDAGDSVSTDAGPFAFGSGSTADPYQIDDCEALQAMELDRNAAYRLVSDIDCAGFDAGDGRGFRPVGSPDFRGEFMGDGHVISGLTIHRPNETHVGLFARTHGATVDSIGIDGALIEGKNHVGCLIGFQKHSSVSEVFCRGEVEGRQHVGGLVGSMQNSTARDSYAWPVVTCVGKCGLLVGKVRHSTIENSYAEGTLSAGGSSILTGIASGCSIIESFFDCDVDGACSGSDATSQTTSNLQSLAFLDGRAWDFTDIWSLRGPGSYACLKMGRRLRRGGGRLHLRRSG